MKIILNDKVYVQKNDLVNLLYIVSTLSIPCPSSVFEKLYGQIFICDSNSKFEFLEFKGKEFVKFFEDLDYIVNYDELKDKSTEELIEYGKEIDKESEMIINQFNNKSEEIRRKEYEKIEAILNSKKLKIYGIRDFMLYRQGDIKFDMPKAVKQNNSNNTNSPKTSGIKRLINTLFKKD